MSPAKIGVGWGSAVAALLLTAVFLHGAGTVSGDGVDDVVGGRPARAKRFSSFFHEGGDGGQEPVEEENGYPFSDDGGGYDKSGDGVGANAPWNGLAPERSADGDGEVFGKTRHHVERTEHRVETHHVGRPNVDFFAPPTHDDTVSGDGDYQADSWKTIRRGGKHASKFTGMNTKHDYGVKHGKGGSFTSGSCETRLSAPMNSVLKCSTYSGCHATCLRDYQFPNGETQLFFYCHDGQWRVRDSTDDAIPQCYPSCLPPCQNGGMCVSPNTCQCRANFFGPYCQYEKKACVDYPPTPNNAKKICNSESCTVTCLEGHQFPDGSAIANIFCKDGSWTPGRPEWKSVPDCKAVCTPPCRNGGDCLSYNICQCPRHFRGPQCQYSVDVCDSRKLNFNGNYNCSGTGESFSCALSCPVGMAFQSEIRVAPVYVCNYSTGVFTPNGVPQCVFGAGVDPDDNEYLYGQQILSGKGDLKTNRILATDLNPGYSDVVNKLFVLEKKQPTAGKCVVWGSAHYRTFDGRIISFKSGCLYTLVSDRMENRFNVQMTNVDPKCLGGNCTRKFNIYVNDVLYRLMLNDAGLPVVKMSLQNFSVPCQLPDLRVDVTGKAVVATLQLSNVKLTWNLKDLVEIDVGEALWNSTGGLCGNMDGHASNDLSEYHDSVTEYTGKWKVEMVGEICEDKIVDDVECNEVETQQAAHKFCNKLMADDRFDACRQVVMVREYYDACRWDFCTCKKGGNNTDSGDSMGCACESIEMFVKECSRRGITDITSWRNSEICAMKCTGGRIYMSCGPVSEPTCKTPGLAEQSAEKCEEGCFCPAGTLADGESCISKKDCPCQLRGKTFQAGSSVPNDCNTCTCVDGQWSCTSVQCSARCEAVGDPHYKTFDGHHYDFMGKCSYYLVKGDNYSVSAENVACDGRISEALSYFPSGTPACTKTVTVSANDGRTVVKLKQGKQITVNGEDVSLLPMIVDEIYIRLASSIFIQVVLPNGIDVWWDGQSRVYVHASPELRGKTQGLCGTFTGSQKDDFITPEGDVEHDITSFANKWKAKESCENIVDDAKKPTHPCDANVQNKELAETYCSNLTGRLFVDCHMFVDPMPYYQNCLYDMCSCKGRMSDCLCPILSAYAKQCSHQGAIIEWRSNVRECGLQCANGQTYQVCGNSCARTCQDISRSQSCKKECVDGCNCPEGRALDNKGECVVVARCYCMRGGMEYPPGHKDIQPGVKGLKFCKCENGMWSCKLASQDEISKYPNESLERQTACSAKRFQEFTHCVPPELVTCKNMHDAPQFSSAICRSGCVCKRKYVLDALTNECVKPSQCPCHHGGKSYNDGDEIHQACNTCACNAGKWKCSEHVCPATCSTWGDSHFRTFDEKIYDFQGGCDYILTKGFLSETESFSVTIEIVPCGSSGVSCPKSVTLSVNCEGDREVVHLTMSKFIPPTDGLKRISVREAGLFVFADVNYLGVVVQWDKSTRVSVRADPKWKGRLKGLCGDYNDNEVDDFRTPAGGIPEVSSQLFGDSWKLHPYCPEATAVNDTCDLHPNRRSWVIEKCGVLKSPLFKPCHSEVSIDPYIERCVFDACGCDQGGDCECLCTAIAAYAEQCNAHGVPIRWRSQQLCPIQCDEKCSEYKPCVQTCPLETCDNMLVHKKLSQLCVEDVCVEGCEVKPCPAGQIYNNSKDLVCVPAASCSPVCKTDDGKEYSEGELIEEDECHTCYCSRHQKTCTGQPCTTVIEETTRPQTTVPETRQDLEKCVPGWSKWINNNHPDEKSPTTDIEELVLDTKLSVSFFEKRSNSNEGQCARDKMVNIKCRDVETKKNYKELGQNVMCSLENGLICSDPVKCNDYEISVLCQCENVTMVTSVETTTVSDVKKEVDILKCNVTQPLVPHPTDCSLYYQCVQASDGMFEQVERECSPNLWFNPETMVCDWPQTVLVIRPDCSGMTETNLPKCVDEWSEWLNVSNPFNDGGDYELISVMARENIEVCKNNGYIKEIECQYVVETPLRKSVKSGVKAVKSGVKASKAGGAAGKHSKVEYFDYRKSPDVDVTCNKDVGLECVNSKQTNSICQDYRIRVLCACEKKTEEYKDVKTKPEPGRNETIVQDCRADERYADCNIHCDQVCHYYGFQLRNETNYCNSNRVGRGCVPGCWPVSKSPSCLDGHLWRDFSTCVAVKDCTCHSNNGTVVKPGKVFRESECEICQCLNNHYTCDRSECDKTTILPTTVVAPSTTQTVITTEATTPKEQETSSDIIIITSTVSPPPHCDEANFTQLTKNVTDDGFSASSHQFGFEPYNSRLTKDGGRIWKPKIENRDQFLQVDLGEIVPVYGAITRGDPRTDEFLTSYYVLFSSTGQIFSYVMDGSEPQLFRGPVTSLSTIPQFFKQPIEGRYVRIKPNTWKNGIAVNLELIGCGDNTVHLKTSTYEEAYTTVLPASTTVQPVCTDKMGLDTGVLRDGQVTVSSSLVEHFKGHDASLNNNGWSPLTNSPHQWIQFDFLEERTLTGAITLGGTKLTNDIIGPAWVESYTISYSHDGQEWSFILDDEETRKLFVGNYDSDTSHTNYFDLPVHAQYIRVHPHKWHAGILLRIEMLGCFLPYPALATEATLTSTTVNEACNVCPGVATGAEFFCPCPESGGRYWDGEKCSPRTQCPCFVGHIAYAVGTVYETEDCSKCTCALGGTADCTKISCPKCEAEKVRIMTSSCQCVCENCQDGYRLCATSNNCVKSSSWCDGYVDCPDDEVNCTATATTPTSTTTTTTLALSSSTSTTLTPQLRCPPVECPPGFTVNMTTTTPSVVDESESGGGYEATEISEPVWSPFGAKSKWGSFLKGRKHGAANGVKGGGRRKGSKMFGHHNTGYANTKYKSHVKHRPTLNKCPEYECLRIVKEEKVCVTPKCSDGYDLIMLETKVGPDECPKHTCKLREIPDGKCNVTGRTFNTFDGVEYKYDICDHLLAEDMVQNSWSIRLVKTCSYIGECKKSLHIKNANNSVVLNADMSITYNGYNYTVEQVQKIGSQNLEYVVKKVSDKFVIFSSMLDFTVIWDKNGNVKVIVPSALLGTVDGMCGFYDGKKETDRRKPDGSYAQSTAEFGDSWGDTAKCETKVCPIHIQNKAWEMCASIKKSPLTRCNTSLNIDKFMSQCVESICSCLDQPIDVRSKPDGDEKATMKCRCDALLDFVTECQESNPSVDLSNWRIVNDCPVDCPAPLVYKECYNKICEICCTDLMEDDPCPVSEGSCFPGCYCPDGLIRDKDACVKPTDCHDCVCDGFGKTRYVTYDRVDYTFNSNCTYVLTETVPGFDGLGFKILTTTGLCDDNRTDATCVKSVAIVYDVHSVQIGGSHDKPYTLYLKVDGDYTTDFPYKITWLEVTENSGKGLIVDLIATHVRLYFYGRDKGFSVRMPSHLYFDKTRGLCGSCNNNQTDDFARADGTVVTDNIEEFGKSWRATNVSSVVGDEEDCEYVPMKEVACLPPPPDEDPCLQLYSTESFGKCHAVIDPSPYVASCHAGFCKGQRTSCDDLESYARECQTAGICLEWRAHHKCPYECPSGLEYKACGLGCPETCDNYKLFREKPEACTSPISEGCVCSEGKVLLNGTCVEELRCQPCDTEGHYPGDKWNPDPCTACSCQTSTTVNCQRTECQPATACQFGYRSNVQKGTETDCCPKFVCIPDNSVPELVCDEQPTQPECGHGQTLKVDVDDNGCQMFSCACKPASECEDVTDELNVIRAPGMVAVLNDSSCCPRVDVLCRKEACPPAPRCREFYEARERAAEAADRCCPEFVCELPNDKCLYEFEYIEDANGGGERRRTDGERYSQLKNGGEVWHDGPCRRCECVRPEYKSSCTTKMCPVPTGESHDYVLELEHPAGQCCPTYVRSACKVSNITYKAGEVWPSPDGDVCKNMSCGKSENGKINKQELIQTCDKDCKEGWKYVEPAVGSKLCCGRCEPAACVLENGIVKQVDSTWFSEDNCTTYSCTSDFGQIHISSSHPLCPNLGDCPPENVVDDGCCKKCNYTTPHVKSICAPEPLPANDTMKLIKYISKQHGFCQNDDLIYDFMECRGTCDSYTLYNEKTGHHDNKCHCCQAAHFNNVAVPLVCDDGWIMQRIVPVPSQCICSACTGTP